MAEFKLSFFYSSSWELSCSSTPFLPIFLGDTAESPRVFTSPTYGGNVFLLLVSVPAQSQPRVELDLSFSTDSLTHWLWAPGLTLPLYLGLVCKTGFMPPASPGTLGKDRGDGCEVLSA